METWRDVTDVPRTPTGRAVTIGAFDGVHLGHAAVLRLVADLARARGLSATVLTFDRHPAEIVRPDSAPCLLTTLEQRIELLEATGLVDECLVLPFEQMRNKSAEEFVDVVLASVLRARLIVVGSDFHFGYRRHGDVPLLQRMGAELGFEVIGLGLVATPDGESPTADALPYSSTRVRTLLAGGDVVGAASVLGRPHEVQGRLDGGDLVVPARVCLPAPGSYDAELRAGADTRPTVATLVTEEAPASERRIALDNGARSGAAALRFVSPRQATS